jgi:hypothetical protein
MKKILIFHLLLIQLISVNAENKKIEIYDVTSNTLITGIVADSMVTQFTFLPINQNLSLSQRLICKG